MGTIDFQHLESENDVCLVAQRCSTESPGPPASLLGRACLRKMKNVPRVTSGRRRNEDSTYISERNTTCTKRSPRPGTWKAFRAQCRVHSSGYSARKNCHKSVFQHSNLGLRNTASNLLCRTFQFTQKSCRNCAVRIMWQQTIHSETLRLARMDVISDCPEKLLIRLCGRAILSGLHLHLRKTHLPR